MPLGVALRGTRRGRCRHHQGLVPGMELSAGNAVAPRLAVAATDLVDAWIAPPEGFVRSTHLVAELRCPMKRWPINK